MKFQNLVYKPLKQWYGSMKAQGYDLIVEHPSPIQDFVFSLASGVTLITLYKSKMDRKLALPIFSASLSILGMEYESNLEILFIFLTSLKML